MKEKIYTIPVNEAFSTDCECPLCYLHKKLENDAVDYALGAAMMEPDYRIISNEKGYCTHHYKMLFEKNNKLSLSLVLDTHLEELRKKINSLSKNLNSLKNEKSSLFKKENTDALNGFCQKISESTDSCVICEKINYTISRYIKVVFYLWENDEDFKTKIINSKGFCIPHFNALIEAAFEYLSHQKACEFAKILYDKEVKELERIQEEIHRFTLKFDYRNRDMDLGAAIDAPKRTIEKLTGYISSDE